MLLDCVVPPARGLGLEKSFPHTLDFRKEHQVMNREVGVWATRWSLASHSSFRAESLKAGKMAQSVACLSHKDPSSDP